MSRDDFNQQTRLLLRDRVNGRCSNPECGVTTLGPAVDPTATASIGVAAHIHAASPGGPRYLKTMSQEERSAAANGIWLCQSCARRIDRDVDLYPADDLRAWKETAEAETLKSIGRRPPSERDAPDQLVMALTRTPVSFAPTAISNVHYATAEALRQYDDRFDVRTAFDRRGVVISLLPREPVPIHFIVGPEVKEEWKRQMKALHDHGEIASLPSDDVRIKGSPLYDKAFTPEALSGGKLTFTPKGHAAVAKLCLIDPDTKSIFQVDDLHGTITSGTQTFKFSGTACKDVLSLSLRMALTATPSSEGDFTLGIDFEEWVGKNVSALPYFERLHELYSKINDGWIVDAKLEVDGGYLLGAKMHVPTQNNYFAAAHTVLEYVNRARTLVAGLGVKVNFRLTPTFSSEEHMRLAEMVNILQGEDPLNAETVDGMSCTLIATEDAANIRFLKNEPVAHRVVFRNEAVEPLTLFGQVVLLPALITTLDGVVPVIEADVESIVAGDAVHVAWQPAADFRFVRRFETDQDKADFVRS
jgi:hypothetical protein